MIRSIRVERNTISLVPEGLDDAGSPLFSSNAMKLLVGPNGSGKTQALTALAKAVVNEDSSLAFSDHALNTYHVIYFSPSPFGAAQLRTENRLDVLTKLNRSNTAKPKARIHDTIRKSFDITNDLRITLEHEATSGHFSGLSVIREALSQLSLISNNRQTDPQILRLLDILRTLRKESEEARSSWVREHGHRGDWFSSSPYKMVMEQEANFDAEIINIASTKLGEVYPLNLRALAWTIERAKREKHDVALSLLPKFGLNAIPSTKHPKGQKDFIDCVTRLSNLAGKLGQPSLSRSAYPLSSTTLKMLNDTDITGVADIGYLQSSSGLSALVHQLTQIDAAIRKVPAAKQKHLVLLIDEGDTFLHLEWQQRYVKFINDYMGLVGRMFASTQVVMTTHSPMLMSDFPRQSIHRFESYDEQGTKHARPGTDLPLRSFGAPLEVIVRSAGNAGTIGLFSADFISALLEQAHQGEPIPDWKIELIDDPVLRDFLTSYNAHRKGTGYAHRSS